MTQRVQRLIRPDVGVLWVGQGDFSDALKKRLEM